MCIWDQEMVYFYFYKIIRGGGEGKWSTARNSSAGKPVLQANFQISLAVFETAAFETCTADMLG
jgi:hypothetical protein